MNHESEAQLIKENNFSLHDAQSGQFFLRDYRWYAILTTATVTHFSSP